MHGSKTSLQVLLFASATWLPACGANKKEPPPDSPEPIAEATVGPEGGELSSADGRVVLRIPSGALSDRVRLSIHDSNGEFEPLTTLDESVYQFEPSGLRFTTPATLTLNYESAPEEELLVGQLFARRDIDEDGAPDSFFIPGLNGTSNSEERWVRAELESFSSHGVIAAPHDCRPDCTLRIAPARDASVRSASESSLELGFRHSPAADARIRAHLYRVERARGGMQMAFCEPLDRTQECRSDCDPGEACRSRFEPLTVLRVGDPSMSRDLTFVDTRVDPGTLYTYRIFGQRDSRSSSPVLVSGLTLPSTAGSSGGGAGALVASFTFRNEYGGDLRANEPTLFDASASKADESIVAYSWDFDGDNVFDEVSTDPSARQVYSTDGVYRVSLRITDALNRSAETSQLLTIGSPTTVGLEVVVGGTGSGSVTSNPPGISCSTHGGSCFALFSTGSRVTLTANPYPDASLRGFSGCDSASGLTCTVEMSSHKSVELSFQN